MPKFYTDLHDKFIEDYVLTSKPKVLEKDRIVMAMNKVTEHNNIKQISCFTRGRYMIYGNYFVNFKFLSFHFIFFSFIEFLDGALHIVSSYDKLSRRGFTDSWVHERNLISKTISKQYRCHGFIHFGSFYTLSTWQRHRWRHLKVAYKSIRHINRWHPTKNAVTLQSFDGWKIKNNTRTLWVF